MKKRRVREAEVLAQCEVARQGNIKLHHSSRIIIDDSFTAVLDANTSLQNDLEDAQSSVETDAL
jgi:hypothetical protein